MSLNVRNTLHTAVSSYGQMVVTMAVSLITIRLATQNLSTEEFGLWSFTYQTVGYFLLLDFGVSSSLSRMFGEPLATRDPVVVDKWLSLCFCVLLAQGALVAVCGLLLRDWVIEWFALPESQADTARTLWTWFLLLQAASFPLRVYGAFLGAQNRSYWIYGSMMTGAVGGLAAFWWGLRLGFGPLAYGWSSTVAVSVQSLIPVVVVFMGPARPRLRFRQLPWGRLRELFGFSWAIFVVGIAVQVSFMSQTLIITKILGLGAAAVYNVSSRIPMLLMQLIWKPFDSFGSRWQIAHCTGDDTRYRQEFAHMFKFTLGVSGAALVAIVLLNGPFILWWTSPGYYSGPTLSVMLGFYVVMQTVMHCFSAPFYLYKEVGVFAGVVSFNVLLEVAFSTLGVWWLGLYGLPLGSMAAGLSGLFWYVVIKGGGLSGSNPWELCRPFLLPLVCTSFLAIIASIFLAYRPFGSPFLALIFSGLAAALLSLPLFWAARETFLWIWAGRSKLIG